jgi:hypothetical protein
MDAGGLCACDVVRLLTVTARGYDRHGMDQPDRHGALQACTSYGAHEREGIVKGGPLHPWGPTCGSWATWANQSRLWLST